MPDADGKIIGTFNGSLLARLCTTDHVRYTLAVCESRDVKGMYRLAREGKIKHFTGVSDPYEEPAHPELIVETDVLTITASAGKVMGYLKERGLIPSGLKISPSN